MAGSIANSFCVDLAKSLFAGLAIWFLIGSAGAQNTGVPAAKPNAVYVRDFDLDAATVESERGILPRGPFATLRPGPFGAKDPQARAKELVDLMSKSLIGDLEKKGFVARRLAPGETAPAEGWLLRGVFTEVQEGNRLRRAVIGFGQGQTDLQVVVAVDDLAQGSLKPLYDIEEAATSNKMPGAVITLNPYVAAAKFVLAGVDLERNVVETAGKIADTFAARATK
ncbi:MAG TPA: DUF4410 domain-containing protein [Alphaproteobacteria bacterium]